MNNRSIAVIDSGVGGLSVWKEIVSLLPHESIIYLADSVNLPYGTKSTDDIKQLSSRLVSFLLSQEVKLVVIACNTMTVNALDFLRKMFPMIPVVGTVPVVKTAATISQSKRIGILSTITTAQSHYQRDLIRTFAPECQVVNEGTDELVPFVERGELQGEELTVVLKRVLMPFMHAKVDTLALGCTHFPFLKDEIKKIMGNDVHILDSGAAVARQTERILKNNSILSERHEAAYTFYTTDYAVTFLRVAKQVVGHSMSGLIQQAEHITL